MVMSYLGELFGRGLFNSVISAQNQYQTFATSPIGARMGRAATCVNGIKDIFRSQDTVFSSIQASLG